MMTGNYDEWRQMTNEVSDGYDMRFEWWWKTLRHEFCKSLASCQHILVYLIEGDENPCEMECFKLIGFWCNNVGWLLSYPVEKCSWVVLQLHELYSFGLIWVFPHKDEIQSFVATWVMQRQKNNCLVAAHFVWVAW